MTNTEQAPRTGGRRWLSLLMGGGALVLAFAVFRHFTSSPAVARPAGIAAAPVRVALVQRRDMAVVERSLGTVLANTTVQLTARVQGTLERANFQEGQFVRKGDLLFQIDSRPFETALAQAKAIYERDQAQLKNANLDKQRYMALRDQGAISTQQRDAAATTADVMLASVAADKAAMDAAQLNLDFTQIRAPIDGKTGPLLIQPGNMVSANGTSVLVTIAQVKPVKVSFTLPQTDLPRIQARHAANRLLASIDIRDGSGRMLNAPVVFTSNVVSAQSGTIELRTSFANEDLALVPGALVNVTVQLNDIRDALVVPRDAINDSPSGSFVYVVKAGKAVTQPVKVLFDDTRDVAISGDIVAGEQVIVEGQLRVVPDGPVHVLGDTAGKGEQSVKGDPAAKAG